MAVTARPTMAQSTVQLDGFHHSIETAELAEQLAAQNRFDCVRSQQNWCNQSTF